MIHSAHHKTEESRVAELKRLITSRQFDSLEMLENAVDDLLWGDAALTDEPSGNEQSAAHALEISRETYSAG